MLFGNVFFTPMTGLGRTPGFWSNQNSEYLLSLCDTDWRDLINDLNMVWPDGSQIVIPEGDFVDAVTVLQDALVSEGTESNMAYILTRQLVAIALNVTCGFMDSPIIYVEDPINPGQYLDIFDLIGGASALIGEYPYAPGDNSSVAEARLAQTWYNDLFDPINNNLEPVYVISPTSCPFDPVIYPPVE